MTVRVKNVWSEPRGVNAGAPQGSVLGSFLFNVGNDDIESGCIYPEEGFTDTLEAHSSPNDYPAASNPVRVGRPQREVDASPIRINEATDQELRILPVAVKTPPWLWRPKEQSWKERQPSEFKFIDDGVNVSCVNMKKVALYQDQNGNHIKIVHISRIGHQRKAWL